MNEEKRDRLIQILGMMGSAHDGEVLNAARLAQRLIGSEAMTWEEVLSTTAKGQNGKGYDYARETAAYQSGYAAGYAKGLREAHDVSPFKRRLTWRSFAIELHEQYFEDLSEWEQGFVESFVERGWNNPTPKQRAVFERIAEGLGIDCPEA